MVVRTYLCVDLYLLFWMTSYLQYSLTLTCLILSFAPPLLLASIPQSDGKPNPLECVPGLPHGLLPPGGSAKPPRKMFNRNAEHTPRNQGSQMLDEEQQVHADLLRDVWAPHPASKTEPFLQFWELGLLARCTFLLQDIDIAATSLQLPCWSTCQSLSPLWTRPWDTWTPKLIAYLINCNILRHIVCVVDCQQTHLVLAWIQNAQKTVQKH